MPVSVERSSPSLGAGDEPAVILLVADGGPDAGWGHLARCSVLGEALSRASGRPSRLTSPRHADLAGWPGSDVGAVLPPTGADVVVIDLLDAAERELLVRDVLAAGGTPVVLGDTDISTEAPFVICPGPQAAGLSIDAPSGARVLLGLRYALVEAPGGDGESERSSAEPAAILVSFGGTTRGDSAAEPAAWLAEAGHRVSLVAPRPPAPLPASVEVHIAPSPDRFRAMLHNSTAAVLAPGVSALEALARFVPPVLVALHDDHRAVVGGFVDRGLAIDGGVVGDLTADGICAAVDTATGPAGADLRAAARGLDIGQGADRCAEAILHSLQVAGR